MGIRVGNEQSTGKGKIFLQGGKIRIDEHGPLRIDTCRCCVCRAASVEIPDGQRTFCALKADPAGLTFPTGGIVGFHNTYSEGYNVVSRSMFTASAPPFPCLGFGQWTLGFRGGGGTAGLGIQIEDASNALTNTYLTPISGYDSTHSCQWGDWGAANDTAVTVLDPWATGTPCTEQNEDQTVTSILAVRYMQGYWVADGFLFTAGVQEWTDYLGAHGENRVSNAGVPFRWFHGYIAKDSHLAIGEHVDIPNLQHITPHSACAAMESRSTHICVTEGGHLRIAPGIFSLPCQPPGPMIAIPGYPPTYFTTAPGIPYASAACGCTAGYTTLILVMHDALNITGSIPAGFVRVRQDGVWYYNKGQASPAPWQSGNKKTLYLVFAPDTAGCTCHKFTGTTHSGWVTGDYEVLWSPENFSLGLPVGPGTLA